MQVDVKRARAKPGKVFVGGLKAEMSDDDIKEAFSQYGVVAEMELPFDKVRIDGHTGLPVSCPDRYRALEWSQNAYLRRCRLPSNGGIYGTVLQDSPFGRGLGYVDLVLNGSTQSNSILAI